jgi:hypothetical protein
VSNWICQWGVPTLCELQRQREGPRQAFKKLIKIFANTRTLRGRKAMKQSCLSIIVASGLTLPAFGQGVDPLIGTWKLNVEKSMGSTGSVPKSLTSTVAGEGQNLTNTGEGVDAQGQAFKVVFRHIYDGMPHPTTGNPDYNSTTYTRIGNTINAIRFKDGKPVEVSQSVIVAGKTWTVTAEGVNANNQPYHYVLVLDRQ